ncbi:hypothetical protein [Paenibacillus brasilensis]|uniref:Uncharacterized protein n=1 Tax=Paenibacillus brasilensis TaxID=128574 RepID=A0ABU0L6J7_9BACL|nr:hypothetical protein [Paenibacillus brasilensis]MDQ0496884.1 hypothetical protein [Paenibacillus brasilensis]
MKTYAEIMTEEVEEWIGRSLTDSEKGTVEWLSGWESETRKNVMVMLRDAFRNGSRQ